MPPLPETGIYPPEIIKEFTEEQFHEAMNPISFFPNNYRFMVAHQRLKGASIAMVFKILVICLKIIYEFVKLNHFDGNEMELL